MRYAKYIGAEFQPHGREGTYDCYGLIRKVLADEFNIKLPSFDRYETVKDEAVSDLIAEGLKDWQKINTPQEGDVIIFNVAGRPLHIGLVIEKGKMLHIEKGKNAVIESYTDPHWKPRIEGFYRYEK